MKTIKRSMSAEAKRIRRSPSLTKQIWSATALAHMAADESCEREWSRNGCTCGACRQARRALGLMAK